MSDSDAVVPPKTVVLFVPALKGPHYAGLREVVKPELHAYLAPFEVAPPVDQAVGNRPGTTFSICVEGRAQLIDVVDVDYEAAMRRLSGESPAIRLWFGVVLIVKAIFLRWCLLLNLIGKALRRRSWSFLGPLLLSLIGIVLVAAWTYLIGASLVAVAEKAITPSQKDLLLDAPAIVQNVVGRFVAYVLPLIEPKGWRFLIAGAVIAAFKALGLDANSVTDVTDAYERYLKDRSERQSELRLSTVVRQPVEDSIIALSKAGYARIVVVGHSFGALVAAEAAAVSKVPVELITVGAFFEYLYAFNRRGTERVLGAIRASPITRWYDVFSRSDYIAASQAFPEAPPPYTGVRVRIPGVSALEWLGTRPHGFYFRCPELLKLIALS